MKPKSQLKQNAQATTNEKQKLIWLRNRKPIKYTECGMNMRVLEPIGTWNSHFHATTTIESIFWISYVHSSLFTLFAMHSLYKQETVFNFFFCSSTSDTHLSHSFLIWSPSLRLVLVLVSIGLSKVTWYANHVTWPFKPLGWVTIVNLQLTIHRRSACSHKIKRISIRTRQGPNAHLMTPLCSSVLLFLVYNTQFSFKAVTFLTNLFFSQYYKTCKT